MTLTLVLPAGERVYTGRQVTFQSPCNSEGLTGLVVQGVTYDLVNALGTTLVANSFHEGAMVSVVFNEDNKKAYVQNADTNAYLEGKFNGVTAEQIGAVQKQVFNMNTSGRLIDFIQDLIINKGYPSGVIQIFGVTPPDCNWVGEYGLAVFQMHNDNYVEVRVCQDGNLNMRWNKFIRTHDGTSPNWLFEWTAFATTNYAVNKAGDTIKGKLYTTATNGALGSATDDSSIRIDGGTSYDKGAFLTLYGKDNAGTSGGFQLVASNNDSTRKELRGLPDGTLRWGNNDIYHAGNKPTAADVGAVNKVGDTMFGALTIKKSDSVTATISPDGSGVMIQAYSDWNKRKFLHIPSDTAAAGYDRLQYVDMEVIGTGANGRFDILHTGNVTKGTTGLTAGSSALGNDCIYLQYE